MTSYLHRGYRASASPASSRRGVLVLLLLGILFALPVAGAQQFTFRHYGQDDGLQNMDVFRLLQDQSGFLWAATENGLFRYDGSGFRRFGVADGLEESMVIDIAIDASGRIWATTNDHLYYFADDSFHAVNRNGTGKFGVGQRLTSLDADHVLVVSGTELMMVHPSGRQWTSAPYFTAKQIDAHPELAELHGVYVDHDRSLWLGCGQTICHVRGNNIDVLGEREGVPQPAAWLAFYRDSHGTLWARSPHYVRALVAGAGSFVDRDITPHSQALFYGSGVLTFGEDRYGNILTQSTTGIARWNGSDWQVFDASNGVSFSDISTILRDKQGSLWFATRGHGLERWLGYGQVENWTPAQGLGNDIVWTMFRDEKNRLWVGDQVQIGTLQDGRIRKTPNFPMPYFQEPDGFAQSRDGATWAVSLPGFLMRSDPRSGRFSEVARLPQVVRLFTDSWGRMWFCTRSGLFVMRHPSAHAQVEQITKLRMAVDIFDDAAEDATGNLWFVSDHHLYRLTHDDSSETQEGQWAQISLDPKLTRGGIRSLAIAPDGSLWIGGGLAGLYHLRVEGDQAKVIASLTVPELVSTDIQFVRYDHAGLLWVGTDLGVEVFDGKHWRLLTTGDGLISNDTDEGAFYADADNSVWIGVNGGLIHLLHPRQLFNDEDLGIVLTSATLGDKPLSVTGSRNRWRWHNSPLDLYFTSPNYDREGSLQFRYRLMGLEPAWNKTSMRSLHYAAVPPGDYVFEVQALDPNRRNASETVKLAFTIRPPWWKTRFFYLFLALLATALSFAIWRWREQRLLLDQAALKQLIAQRTSELEAEKLELMAAREALEHQASHDALTGLWNRPAILEILEREMARARRERSKLTVVLADLDHFKQVNDTYGHLAGDAILRDAAHRMMENIRHYDFMGRYGGEEFLIILPGFAEGPEERLMQLHRAVSEKPFDFDGKPFNITSSFGAASLEDSMMVVEDMVRAADEALYQAKDNGRNCIVFHLGPGQPDPLFGTH